MTDLGTNTDPENFCDPRSAKYRPQYAALKAPANR